MKISIDTHPELIGKCTIIFNKEDITNTCIQADDETGVVIVFVRNGKGIIRLNKKKSKVHTQKLKGIVEIRA